jgi:type VI protein secretion system component VasF
MATARDARQLKAEIEQAREQLGATVEQLAAKVDVKSRARAKATDVAGRVSEHWVPLSLGTAGAVMLVTAYLAWHWSKSARR